MTQAVSSRRVVRIGIVQSVCSDDRRSNIAQAIAGVTDAADDGADVICLQELFASQYPCQSEDHASFALADPIPGMLTDQLSETAKKHNVVIVGNVFERRAPGLFHNTVVIFDSDPEKIGTAWGDQSICSLDVFEKVMEERGVELVILAIPADAAQEVASRAVEAGVNGILNFAPIRLNVPAEVPVEDVNLVIELEALSFQIKQRKQDV